MSDLKQPSLIERLEDIIAGSYHGNSMEADVDPIAALLEAIDRLRQMDATRNYCEEVIARNEQGDTWRMACASVAANVLNELNGKLGRPD